MRSCKKNVNDTIVNFKIVKGVLYVLRSFKRTGYVEEFLVSYIPDALIKKAFEVLHSDTTSGHRGFKKTLRNSERISTTLKRRKT